MVKKDHPYHKKVRNQFKDDKIDQRFDLLEDAACTSSSKTHGNKRTLPLYTVMNKQDLCWVDMLIFRKKMESIGVIIEIEESDIGPIHVCGKYLASALTSYYDDGVNDKKYLVDTLFIQIVKPRKTKTDKNQEPAMAKKWKIIEDSINQIIHINDCKITKYRLFWGTEIDGTDKIAFNSPNNYSLYDEIISHMNKIPD